MVTHSGKPLSAAARPISSETAAALERERLRRELLQRAYDPWRTATVLEPRGSEVVVGALLCTPVDPASAAGVIFFNNQGYLGMQ